MRARQLLPVALSVITGCGGDERATPAERVPVPVVTEVSVSPLPAWDAPTIRRTAQRVSATDRIVVVPGSMEPGARVDVATARGPTPARCGEATPITADEGGTYAIDVDPMASVTVCVRDAGGNVRATATSEGFRSVPTASATWRDGALMLEQAIEPLDDDVTAVVITSRARPRDAEGQPTGDEMQTPLGCRVTAGSGPDDDPPEVCTYDCAGDHVVLEIPRAAWDAVIASPGYRPSDETGELLTPTSIGVAIPIALPDAHDETRVCVRTRGGVVADTTWWRPIASEPWSGCDADTVAGCASQPFDEIEPGDVLLGLDDAGSVVRAPVRRVVRRRVAGVYVYTTRGSFVAGLGAQVRTADGGDASVDELRVGARLWSRSGTAVVTALAGEESSSERRTSFDLEGADHVLVNGFAIRDAGTTPEIVRAPRHDDEGGFALATGDGDCALAAEWPAAATRGHAVTLAVDAVEGHDHHVTRDALPEPHALTRTIDAAAIDAIAGMAPGARVRVQLFGDAIGCSTPHWVSRFDETGAPIAHAMSWTSAAQCIAVGTPVDTPHGAIAIEKLERGDEVTSFDPERGTLVTARVLGTTRHAGRAVRAITLEDGTVLRATPDHVVMAGVPPVPRPVRDLASGDPMSLHRDGTIVRTRVRAIRSDGRDDVVELRVTAPDTYFASGVLVHNY